MSDGPEVCHPVCIPDVTARHRFHVVAGLRHDNVDAASGKGVQRIGMLLVSTSRPDFLVDFLVQAVPTAV